MKRAVVCVATTERYQRGLDRLARAIQRDCDRLHLWPGLNGSMPPNCPTHERIPYGFKAFSLKQAADAGADLLLWCDACILPIRPLAPLWERIEREGYWFARNGWTNYQWTADSAYADLFRDQLIVKQNGKLAKATLDEIRCTNKLVPHVVATSFGLNLKHPIGKAFLDEYYRLASETRAFCGPWINSAYGDGTPISGNRVTLCGPSDVMGHRHDQTAASVIAWRLGMTLTDPPDVFSYPPGDERTILLADGGYE